MGMFDTVSFEDVEKHFDLIDWGDYQLDSKIVDKIKKDNNFQTKCLDNYLGNYVVTSCGLLQSQHFEQYEHIIDENAPLKFRIQEKGEYWMDEDFHGIIIIYNAVPVITDDLDFLISFKLKFTDGKLVSIKCCDIDKF